MIGRSARLILACMITLGLLGSMHLGGQRAAAAGSGRIFAWGLDTSGQLGTPSNANDATANQIGIGFNAVAVTGGTSHSLALKPDGTLMAWGSDSSGQLGDGTASGTSTRNPQAVPGVGGIRAIAARGNTNLAVRSNGTVLAWGSNADGLLGNGTTGGIEATPTAIPNLTNVVAVALGTRHALALKGDGTVVAWGADASGQLGDGTIASPSIRATPEPVAGLGGVKAIGAGTDHSVALLSNGTVRTWGSDLAGQHGDGTISSPSSSASPVVSDITGVRAIAVGELHTLALKGDGTVWGWGLNSAGQLGNGITGVNSPIPVQVTGLANVLGIAAGSLHSVALRADGTVFAWGNDNFGQIGDGTPTTTAGQPNATQVPGLTGIGAIGVGRHHTLAIRADNFPVVWGHDSDGQLGDGGVGNPVDDQTPNSIGLADDLRAVAGGGAHTLALKADGTLLAWGEDNAGQLGDGQIGGPLAVATPQAVVNLTNIVAIAAGDNHSLALKADGTVWAWGADETANGGAIPRLVTIGAAAIGIAAGRDHSLVLRVDGTVVAWGDNNGGQLGVSGADQTTPVAVPGVSQMVAVAAGGSHSMALRGNGTVWAWGDDGAGQLGDGTIGSTGGFDADQVIGLGNALAISAGSTHSLALRADGTVWAWGADFQGANVNSQATPAQVGGLSGVTALAAGLDFSAALRGDGTVMVWGINAHGQLAGTAPLNATDVSPNPVGGVTNLTGLGVGPRSHHVVVLK